MSYDLVVFEPCEELRERSTFLNWYEGRTDWKDGLDYSDPSNATPALQEWYRTMIETFPPLNGPDRPQDMSLCPADYSIGHDIIYVGFSGGRGSFAYETMFRLASAYGVGFFNASGNGEVWFPDSHGELELLHQHQEGDPPGRMQKMIDEAIARHGVVNVDTVPEALVQMMDMMSKNPKDLRPIVVTGNQNAEGKSS
jgi:hypothetical protein